MAGYTGALRVNWISTAKRSDDIYDWPVQNRSFRSPGVWLLAVFSMAASHLSMPALKSDPSSPATHEIGSCNPRVDFVRVSRRSKIGIQQFGIIRAIKLSFQLLVKLC